MTISFGTRHGGDVSHLLHPAAVLHVGHDDFDGLGTAERDEAIDAEKRFAASRLMRRRICTVSSTRFGSTGSFIPSQIQRLQAARYVYGAFDIEEAMAIDHQPRLRPHRSPHRFNATVDVGIEGQREEHRPAK